MTNTNITTWIVTTSLSGAYFAEGEPEPFEGATDEALSALLDEAEFQLDGEHDDDCFHDSFSGCLACSDDAMIESLRGSEGRGDLLLTLEREGAVGIRLESYASGFGGVVTLSRAE